MPKMLDDFKIWFRSMIAAPTSDVPFGETASELAEEAATAEAGHARLQSRMIIGIFALLVLHFLVFASPILIPISLALLSSMLLAPFVGLLERVHVPRVLGSLIVVVAVVGILFGIAASLSGPVESCDLLW